MDVYVDFDGVAIMLPVRRIVSHDATRDDKVLMLG